MKRRSPIEELTFRELHIPFNTTFKHASAERGETQSIWVEARRGNHTGHGEACPRTYVTGETVAGAKRFHEAVRRELLGQVYDLDSLRAWTQRRAQAINLNAAAWCALELALLDLFAGERGVTMEALLSIEPLNTQFHYSAVLGDSAPETFAAQFEKYRALGFKDYKVKLSGDPVRDSEKLDCLIGQPNLSLRCDANNLWSDPKHATRFFVELGVPFRAIEEPLRAFHYAELEALGRDLNTRIVLDESVLFREQLARFADNPERWLVNVRISKMGGLLRALATADYARSLGLGIIVGAHVGETSLLTRAGLTVASHAGDALFAQEGGFGTWLLERDICEPSLKFSHGGVLRVDGRLSGAGWGLTPVNPAPSQ